jgi:8-oxo-dGTP diphosphatase
MTVYLVRHAKAGARQRWYGPDDLRPLSKVGRSQANGIAKTLARSGVARIFSSPYVRCVQTVAPLAKKLHIDVEVSDALAEGAPLEHALRLVEKVLDDVAVLCTHGDVMLELLNHFARAGVPLDDDRLEKAGTWVLDVVDGAVRAARYVLPPTS